MRLSLARKSYWLTESVKNGDVLTLDAVPSCRD